MASTFIRQLWSGIGHSTFLRPTTQIQSSVRTKMARRINRHRVPTHTKPSDKWAQRKTVYVINIIIISTERKDNKIFFL